MLDRLMRIAAFLVLAGFLGILLYRVPRFDLGGVLLITMIGVFWDFFVAPSSDKRH